MKEKKVILGIDIGTNSIGWALFESDEDGVANKFLDGGINALAWDINLDSDSRKHPNQTRRGSRLTRRLLRRRSERKQNIRKIAKEHLQVSLEVRGDLEKQNPYTLRAKALKEKISLGELARIWLFFAGHRGFRSSRKEKSSGAKGNEKILNQKWKEILTENNCRTVGEYLYQRLQEGKNVRRLVFQQTKKKEEKKITRSLIKEEFEAIWEKQKEFHPELTEELKKKVEKTLFFQRPLPSQKHLVARCKWNPNKKTAPKSHPLYEKYRIYDFVANLRIDNKPLDQEQKKKVYQKLFSTKDYKPSAIAKSLKVNEKKLSHTEKIAQQGADFISKLQKTLGKKSFKKLSREDIEMLWYYLYSYESPWKLEAKLKDFFKEKLEEEAKAEEVSRKLAWEYFLPEGYGNVSLSVIRKVLPWLEDGLDRHQSFLMAGVENAVKNKEKFKEKKQEIIDFVTQELHSDKGDYMEKLIRFLKEKGIEFQEGKLYDPRTGIRYNARKEALLKQGEHFYIDHVTNNPIVKQILHNLYELIRKINEIYFIDEIYIEFPRGLRASKEDRKKISDAQKENEEKRQEAKAELRKAGRPLTKDSITRYLLWKEQKNKCPYCGKSLGTAEAFDDQVTEIDHIFPYSVSLDNSFANKVLACSSCNQKKGRQTPWEWMGEANWDAYLRRVKFIYNHIPNKKKKKEAENILKKFSEELKSKFGANTSWGEINEDVLRLHKCFFEKIYEDIESAEELIQILKRSYEIIKRKDETLSEKRKKFLKVVKYIYSMENPKYHRLISKKTREDFQEEWLNRQISDTAYISRLGREILEDIFKIKVVPVKAGVVARLRHLWGLNTLLVPVPEIPEELMENVQAGDKVEIAVKKGKCVALQKEKKKWDEKIKDDPEIIIYSGEILKRKGDDKKTFVPDKQRYDHRHHFIDAAVTALVTPKYIKQVYDHLRAQAEKDERPNIAFPYENFRKDLQKHLQNILIYFPPKRRSPITTIKTLRTKKRVKAVRGQLHKETFYGRKETKQNGEIYFVTRKPIGEVAKKKKQIVDEKLKERLEQFLANSGEITEFRYHKGQMPVRHVRIKFSKYPDEPAKEKDNRLLSPGYKEKTWVMTRNNHHADIYFNPQWKINTKKYQKYEFEVVSFREAVRCYQNKQRLEGRREAEGLEYLFSLYINDLVLLKPENMSQREYEQIINDLEMLLENSKRLEIKRLVEEKGLANFLYRVQKMDKKKKQFFFRLHREATTKQDREYYPFYKSVKGADAWEKLFPVKIKLNRTGEIIGLQKGYKK